MARHEQADVLADEIVEIADEEVGRLMGGATDSGAVQRNRLRVDARKWVAAKLKPKVYGDKVQQEHVGLDGAPIQVLTCVPVPEPSVPKAGEDQPQLGHVPG